MSLRACQRLMLVLALALAPQWGAAQIRAGVPAVAAITEEPIKGYAVVIGGALKADNEDVWGRMVELSGGKGARWVVFGTASENPDKTARRIADLLEKRGAVAETLPVAPMLKWVDLDKAVRDPALLDAVKSAQGIFFSGGAQERIVLPTPGTSSISRCPSHNIASRVRRTSSSLPTITCRTFSVTRLTTLCTGSIGWFPNDDS